MTFKFAHDGHVYDATVGLYPDDGKVGEVFLDTGKAGTALAIATRDSAVALSIGLQQGATVTTLGAAMLRNEDGSPAGVLGRVCDEITGLFAEGET